MSDKKYTNPAMTPEWFASLLETCVLPPQHKEVLEGLPMPDGSFAPARPEVLAHSIRVLIEGASGAPVESTAPPPSVDPGLLEGLKFCLDDAKDRLDDIEHAVEEYRSNIDGALSNLRYIMKDLKL